MILTESATARDAKRYAAWRAATVMLLVLGYAGIYLCRSNLSVVMPLIIREMTARGISADVAKIQLGSIASFGVLAYALGKFPSGWIADSIGGRRNFLVSMGGSVLFTLLFSTAGGFPVFSMIWMGNRFLQAMGWSSMVKIASNWFSYSTYGTVMGILSLSFLFGDAAAREFMALLLGAGLGWRAVFWTAAGTLAVLAILNLFFLKESPRDIDLKEPDGDPEQFVRNGEESSAVFVFARSPLFWLVCILCFGVTILRETFNLWIPTYLTQAIGLTASDAAHKSALFPLFGGLSVLVAGYLSDRLGKSGRAAIFLFGVSVTAALLMALALGRFGGSAFLPVALISAAAFMLMGPYSYLCGAIALDFGGKKSGATAAGLIDGVGYLGGILAGNSIAHISVAWGWAGAFIALAAVALLTAAAAVVFLISQRRRGTLRIEQ